MIALLVFLSFALFLLDYSAFNLLAPNSDETLSEKMVENILAILPAFPDGPSCPAFCISTLVP